MPIKPPILTINSGSSSIRFAVYAAAETLEPLLYGKVERIGLEGAGLTFVDVAEKRQGNQTFVVPDHRAAAGVLLDWLAQRTKFEAIGAVGHRVVHGMRYATPQIVNDDLVAELKRFSPYDPEHMPAEIELIEMIGQRQPQLLQVVCFDTTFHANMPRVATLLPIPRRFDAKGVRRYGFHGLSYAYLIEELERLGDTAASKGRVILAHLGSGASMSAVLDGRSIDTSMGFTPTSGLPMSTRSGDLDPGLVKFLARTEGMTAEQFDAMVSRESGLLGVSELSPDVRDLLAREAEDVRAAEAVALFCYRAKTLIGSFAAALGGVDTLVFAGGIGENSPTVRARICQGLGFLGIELQESRNAESAQVISADDSRTTVRVIRTDEELMIARAVLRAGAHVFHAGGVT